LRVHVSTSAHHSAATVAIVDPIRQIAHSPAAAAELVYHNLYTPMPHMTSRCSLRTIISPLRPPTNPIIMTLIQALIESAPGEAVTEAARGVIDVQNRGRALLYHIDQAMCLFFRALYHSSAPMSTCLSGQLVEGVVGGPTA